jgi:hypothetical protein
VIEGEAVKPHGDRDAADEGGIVLPDQEHVSLVIAGLDPPAGRSPFGEAEARQSIIFERLFSKCDGCPGQARA